MPTKTRKKTTKRRRVTVERGSRTLVVRVPLTATKPPKKRRKRSK